MDATELEKSYQSVTISRVNEVMYLRGSTLKEWAALSGKPRTHTSEGFPIHDQDFYMLTAEGVWLVE